MITPRRQEQAGTAHSPHHQCLGTKAEAGDTTMSLGTAGQRRTSHMLIDLANSSVRKMRDIVSMTSRLESKMPI